jgi:hypothetical protein
MSGDVNPTHVDPEFARSSQFREVVGHSMWGSVLISSILGTEFPAPAPYVGQTSSSGARSPSATPSRSPSPAPIASSTTTTCCSNACASTRTA